MAATGHESRSSTTAPRRSGTPTGEELQTLEVHITLATADYGGTALIRDLD